MKIIAASIALLIASCSSALAEPYDPTDPDHVQWCVGWAYDMQIDCMDIMCASHEETQLPPRMRLCQDLYEHLSACCVIVGLGGDPDTDGCPPIPDPVLL